MVTGMMFSRKATTSLVFGGSDVAGDAGSVDGARIDVEPDAGRYQIGRDQAEQQRHRGDHVEVHHRFDADCGRPGGRSPLPEIPDTMMQNTSGAITIPISLMKPSPQRLSFSPQPLATPLP